MQSPGFLPDRLMQKRCLDIALATLILLVAAIPLALAAALVRLFSGKPIFFRQVRIGRGGAPFVIYKLRTMRTAFGGPRVTIGGSTHITPEGRFLRATKLDELPQLFNVLKGDMSLVGPRPEVPEYVANYSAQDKDIVFSVRPGLTDLASIRFRKENNLLATKTDPLLYYERVVVPIKLRYSRFYVRKAALPLDLYILMLTATSLFRDFAETTLGHWKDHPAALAGANPDYAQPLGAMRRKRRRMRALAGPKS
jgi:lipopolysaccharide/colanic/teichoic acid biosynthesis glycosyltransferase